MRLLLLLALFLSAPAWAQNQTPVYQSGSMTPGHAAKFLTNGIIGDAGPAGGGAPGVGLTELGITNTGTPFCINDAPIVPGSGYHQLCLGAFSLGGGLLTYNPYGTASPLPFDCLINGVFYPNCFSGGTGTVTNITATLPIVVTPDPITATGDISCPTCATGGVAFADPTATIGTSAVNGSATTAMRSDAAPAIPQCSSSTFGACKVDNTTITASSGVITTVAATTSVPGIAKLNNVGYPAGWIAANDPNNAIVVNVHQASTITAIMGTVETPVGAAATVQVNKAGDGVACSAGTNLATGTFDANGTAATNQTLTLVGGATDNLADGDRICYVTTGGANWTLGVGIGTITIFYAPS